MRMVAMQRSSETIGTIAAALAKAQAQLVNPEKSLVATIRSDQAGTSERSFRYAPLSTGLTIARSITVETRPRGGRRLVLILSMRLAPFG